MCFKCLGTKRDLTVGGTHVLISNHLGDLIEVQESNRQNTFVNNKIIKSVPHILAGHVISGYDAVAVKLTIASVSLPELQY